MDHAIRRLHGLGLCRTGNTPALWAAVRIPRARRLALYVVCARLLQVEMHLLRCQLAITGFQVEPFKDLAGAPGHGGLADNAELVATTVYLNAEALLELPQVCIEFTTQFRQPFIVGWFQGDID